MIFAVGFWVMAAGASDADLPLMPRVADIIACKTDVRTYNGFALAVASGEIADIPGLTKVETDNPFLSEYEAAEPVSVFGYTTRRVIFTSAGMMAVLDTPDAAEVAAKLGVPAALETPGKFLGEKTVSEIKETADGEDWIYSVKLNVSTVTSHPGKTLAGCTYTVGGSLFE